MKKIFIPGWSVIVSALLLFPVSAFSLVYNGSSTMGEELMPKAAAAFGKETGIRFGNIGIEGSEAGITQLLAKKIDIAGVSRPITPKDNTKGLLIHTVGYDGIGIFVNRNNPVRNLSKEQIRDIFTGKIGNWKEVGGNDARIEVVTEIIKGSRATIKVFRELALEGKEYGPTKEVDSPHACVRYVIRNPNAITHASSNFLEPGVEIVSVDSIFPSKENIATGKYKFYRPLLLLTYNPPPDDVKKFLDFLSSPKGSEIIKKYFTPAK